MVDESVPWPTPRLVRDYSRQWREAAELSDEQARRSGRQRVLGQCDSGPDFRQASQDGGENVARRTCFDALQATRWAAIGREVADRSCEVFTRHPAARERLGAAAKLGDRGVRAVDGHQVALAPHATHDAKHHVAAVV